MKKRLMAVVAAALLPALGMLAYNELALRHQKNAELNTHAAQAARHAASEIDRIIDGMRSLLVAVSSIPSVIDKQPSGCGEALKKASQRLFSIRTILVLSPDGKLVCDSTGTPPGTDFSDRGYFKEALKSNDIVVGTYTLSRISDSAILPVAMPIKSDDQVVAVVATGVRLDWLNARIRERGVVDGGAVTIADREGTIVARDPMPERFVGTRIPQTYRHLVHEKAPGTIQLVSQDGTERILGYEPATMNTPLYISAGISTEEAFATINRATAIGIAFIVAGSIFAFLSAIVVGNRFILGPIEHIVVVIQKWRNGDKRARVGMHDRNGELGVVAEALDHLLDQLEEEQRRSSAAEQRRALLSRELSHRVKNTLSIIQAIARQTFRSPHKDEYRNFSSRVQALAGAYDALLSESQEPAELEEVVNRALVPHQSADVAVHIGGPSIQLSAQCVVAMSLVVHELATNAVKYGALSSPNGSVEVSWKETADTIEFLWTETSGPKVIPPEKEGFGSKLVRSAFPVNLKPQTEFDFALEGLRFKLNFLKPEAESAGQAPQAEVV